MSATEWHRQVLGRIGQLASGSAERPLEALGAILDLALSHRLQLVTDFVLRATGGVVQSGPFAGMNYLAQSAGSLLAPKLLGCYEEELHPVLARVARAPYSCVVNIGCGEGYYAVGLARLLPAATVRAFDAEARSRELCRQLADLNGVAQRVGVDGACDVARLQELARPGALIVCDCEGGERALLDLAQAPGLATCDVLVELHDFLDPQTSSLIASRFAATHRVELIAQAGRNPNAFPLLRGLAQVDQALAVLEGRPGPTPWAFLTCSASPGGAVLR